MAPPPLNAPARGRSEAGRQRLTVLWVGFCWVPQRAGGRQAGLSHPTPEATPQSPARAVHRRTCARVTRSARRRDVHRQPRPTHAGPTGRPSPEPPQGGVGEGGREEGRADGEEGEPAGPRTANRASQRSALRGTKATDACDCPSRGKRERFRLMAKRPSDRRSPGRNPGPQGAFEVSMINVSCNSH